MNEQRNELHEFIRQATQQIQDSYILIQKRAQDDPGTAGDQGEECWANLLRNWLPSIFHITTKGRILGVDGTASPQVDIIVLRPEYPKGLIDTHQKLYLAGGVLAAFECKTTLRKEHINKFFKNSIAIKSLMPQRKGTPYEELHSGILYGLLAHSHEWKSEKDQVINNLSSVLYNNLNDIEHPRLIPDMLCVSNLCNWSSGISYIGPTYIQPWDSIMIKKYGKNGGTGVGYFHQYKSGENIYPIGGLLETLIKKLAYEYEPLKNISEYYNAVNIGGGGEASARMYQSEIYSTDVYNKIMQGHLVRREKWSKWSMFFI